jgi:ABC-type nitrate/sulfonate/bicarbonate transport system substrate-binding protein
VTRSVPRARALALIAAGSAALLPVRARAQTAPKIRLGSVGAGDSYALPFYAQEGGFFTRAGLNVEVQEVSNPGSIIAAVAGNSLDAGFADPPLLANASNRGLPMAYFAAGGLYSADAPTTVLCVAPNSTIRTARDLYGNSIAIVVLASIGAAAIRAWIKSSGADLTQIKLIELPFTTMVTAVIKGDVGAAFVGEPYLTQAKNDIRRWANAFDAIANRFLINACFSARPWLARNPDLAARLAQALSETARWANAHHDESAPILAKYSKVPVDVARTMTRVRFADFDVRLVQPVLDTAFKFKLLERPVNAADIAVRVTG